MTIKEGVNISNLDPVLLQALERLDHLWRAFFPEDKDGMTVTSGHEGFAGDKVHHIRSKHYITPPRIHGEAVDLRFNDVLQWKASIFATVAWMVLTVNFGDKFKLFPEAILTDRAHLHIQLQ